MKTLIVIPAYNEEQNLSSLIPKINQILYDNKISYQIIIINDWSSDGTKKVAESFADWRGGDRLIFVSDISKAKRDFNLEPKININEGINMLIDWAKKSSLRFRKEKSLWET